LQERKLLGQNPIRDHVAAISVGVFKGTPVLDLDYAEDSNSGCDMNVVMTGNGGFVEVQGTAEGEPFARAELDALLVLASRGISQLISFQRQALKP
jgi:ribonuclease PH